ncbi:MAG: CopG family transcriptional regulator [Armatimonadota bacterium]|nr:CopG family transcriptional regulator [Armatimonadota bacterium]MDR7550515.1 CopG family transcriptional regulator [Armatimonadota bacterium]
MHKTTLYLPPGLHRALKDAARRHGRSQAEMVREAVERYLKSLECPTFKSLGAGRDGSLPAAEDEAWLEREWSKP